MRMMPSIEKIFHNGAQWYHNLMKEIIICIEILISIQYLLRNKRLQKMFFPDVCIHYFGRFSALVDILSFWMLQGALLPGWTVQLTGSHYFGVWWVCLLCFQSEIWAPALLWCRPATASWRCRRATGCVGPALWASSPSVYFAPREEGRSSPPAVEPSGSTSAVPYGSLRWVWPKNPEPTEHRFYHRCVCVCLFFLVLYHHVSSIID